MVELAHSVRGRLRIRISSIRQDRRSADDACAAVLSVPGVTRVAVNTVTGSLVISYDALERSAAAVWEDVRCRLGSGGDRTGAVLSDPGSEPLPSPGAEWVDHATRAAIDALIGKMVEHAAAALVRAVI
ncbi:MAG TPA: hypothetical protein VGD08_08770 [Stellaceae bacterium]